MFSSNCLTQRRKGSQGARVLISLLAVFTFMFMACQLDDDEELADSARVPVGEWDSGFDSYVITNTTLKYFSEGYEWDEIVYPDTILKGNIEKAVDFSDNAGVLIIKITEATFNTVGKYTGVYYRDYTLSDIKLATAIGPEPDYDRVETNSLSEALLVFTVDNVGTHVSMWGSYSK